MVEKAKPIVVAEIRLPEEVYVLRNGPYPVCGVYGAPATCKTPESEVVRERVNV